ncbi:PadR family transcriptional regulator [Gordonia iterans]|uniref:PadR family transcriptional regulator n=2 Tax=Gordonia iterans TaxID=1004901 RepID=A0A2S0KKV1_9ACTN|nr:PadR family transcriptional regulator [Gordonia iterans]
MSRERDARAGSVLLEVVDPGSPGAQFAVGEYFAELARRFPTGFDVKNPAHGDSFRGPNGVFVLASSGGRPVGCGAVQTIAPGVGEIKRMWVHDDWRGLGLGSRLLRELECRAAELGHTTVRLDTNGALTTAIAMYGRAGYSQVDRYNNNPYATHFFEKTLPEAAPPCGSDPR